ncbi:MAG: 8-oxoguanine deaminase [Gammaproteobacteria bacterium]|nr:8-oxoguanine deaminase [Gammaproteobacteria bacterium]
MERLFVKRALLPEGWTDDVRVTIADDGRIGEIEASAPLGDGDFDLGQRLLLPAQCNLHSHTFQRAMAGMTEHRTAGRDSFWTWRELMYRFVERLTPRQIEAIAALVYMEMLESGYACVGEFHYIHHQPDGKPYDGLAETTERIFAAAGETGIGLTHLPVLYSHGGAGEKALKPGQIRFGNDPERYWRIVEEAVRLALEYLTGDVRVGIAPHSLRATSPAQLQSLTNAFADGPVHMHIAEQPAEVDEVVEWLGEPPVAWLLHHIDVDARWCLVHATHMTGRETLECARSGAVAGLCPITESNLGDGIFNGVEFLDAGGRFGIGSDSNVRIALSEELRLLEYSQRLRDNVRNVLPRGEGSVGAFLYRQALHGGAQALGRESGAIETGRFADFVAVDGDHIAFHGLRDDRLLDAWIFAADDRVVTDVWSAGRHCVRDGRHINREEIIGRYKRETEVLLSSL